MQTANEPYLLDEEEWVVRVRAPGGEPHTRPVLMLHGLMGNETVMWVFARTLPNHSWLFAPRAPLPADDGFSWVPRTQGWPTFADFAEPCDALIEALERWTQRTSGPAPVVDVIGFSQGAALAYVLAALHPEKVGRVLALAGFLPHASAPDAYAALRGKQIFIAHGTRDETIPVRHAEEAVQTLDALGADVHYCYSEVGHKLGANCMKSIETFFERTAGSA